MMKKTLIILTICLLSSFVVEGQNRKRVLRKRNSRIERLEIRADYITDQMVREYKLSEGQKEKLVQLNRKWIAQNRARARSNNKGVRGFGRRELFTSLDSNYIVLPSLYRELRILEMSKDVTNYRMELKNIMTSAQFKQYEDRLKEVISRVLEE